VIFDASSVSSGSFFAAAVNTFTPAYVDPMSPPEVNAFVNAQQAQWRPVLETFEASIKK